MSLPFDANSYYNLELYDKRVLPPLNNEDDRSQVPMQPVQSQSVQHHPVSQPIQPQPIQHVQPLQPLQHPQHTQSLQPPPQLLQQLQIPQNTTPIQPQPVPPHPLQQPIRYMPPLQGLPGRPMDRQYYPSFVPLSIPPMQYLPFPTRVEDHGPQYQVMQQLPSKPQTFSVKQDGSVGPMGSEGTPMLVGMNQSPGSSVSDTYDLESRTYLNGFSETYKPIAPKRNRRPRINKLDKTGAVKHFKKLPEIIDIENSLDPYYEHFKKVLNIHPVGIQKKPPAFFNVKNELEKKLFDLFIHEVSRCMDMFVEDHFFGEIVPEMALLDETGLIMNSMFSLSALMLQRVEPNSIDQSTAINYYHETITCIRHHLHLVNGDDNGNSVVKDGIIARCLLSTILLGVYEMFFLASDNTYVKGAVGLLNSLAIKSNHNSPLRESPFLSTCFWALLACDLILSLKFNSPAMFSIKNFWMQIDPSFIDEFLKPTIQPSPSSKDSPIIITRKDAVWWLHRALIDFSIVNEFNMKVVVFTEQEHRSNSLYHEWAKLRDKLEDFEKNIPQPLKPLIYKPASSDLVNRYPTIYFRDELAAFINLQFKLAQISLYQSLVQKTDLNSPEVQHELSQIPRNHAKLIAKDVIGILQTYDQNLYLWPINIHTVRHVARYLHEDPDEYKQLEQVMERIIKACHFIFQLKRIIG